MKIIGVFLALAVVSAFGGDTPETKEHKFLVAKLDVAQKLVQQKKAEHDTEKTQFEEAYKAGNRQEAHSHLDAMQAITAYSKNLITQVTVFIAQIESVDACTKLYRATIDKKQSDFTGRESQAIKPCVALDLYPLDMSAATQNQSTKGNQ